MSNGMVMVAAAAAVMAIVVRPDDMTTRRLGATRMRRHGQSMQSGQRSPHSDRPARPRVGIGPVVASLCAAMRGGATLEQAIVQQTSGRGGPPPSARTLRIDHIRTMLDDRALPKERKRHVAQVAADIAAAGRASAVLGCPAVQCLEAVGASYRRARLLDDLRSQSFAVPDATAKLLVALPVITVMFGELLGARPLVFLFGSAQGMMCLGLGLCCYAGGVLWMRAMLRDMEDARGLRVRVRHDGRDRGVAAIR